MASDLFVFPSRGDVWGLVVGEVMAYGLPVITSDRYLTGLVLVENGKNGFIFEIGNYKKLAEQIMFMYNNPRDRKCMGENNLIKIMPYSIESSAKNDACNVRDFEGNYDKK